MRFPCSPDTPIPHLDVNADTGNFAYAVHQMPPGKDYMAGEYLTWPEFAKAWARVTGATVRYKEVTFDEMVDEIPDRDLGVEVALMFAYSSGPGYDGGMDVLKAEDLRKVSWQSLKSLGVADCAVPGGHRLPYADRGKVAGAAGVGGSVGPVKLTFVRWL